MSTFIVYNDADYQYNIDGVFSTLENAEKYIKIFNLTNSCIEEHKLDQHMLNVPDDYKLFRVCIHENGNIINVLLSENINQEQKKLRWDIKYDFYEGVYKRNAYLDILARDENHAKEIATEIYKNKS